MRLARIELDGRAVTAYVDPEGRAFSLGLDLDILADGGTEIRKTVEPFIENAINGSLAPSNPGRWLPPIRPGKVIGVAMNNSAFAPLAHRYFDKPAFFMKAATSLVGHREAVIVEEDFGLTHPEPELACVIGKKARRLDLGNALDVIFGYTIINDITSAGLKDEDSLHLQFPSEPPGHLPFKWRETRSQEDWDLYLTYHFRSKCTDTFGPIGPWITTADEIEDPNSLDVTAWLGDRLIAKDSTANLSFSISEVLVHLTRYSTLEPGDIVHFGTAIDPRRFALREANIVEDPSDMKVRITGLGELVNPVVIRR